MFTVLKLDDFVPKDHPLRPIRTWLNDALKRMDDVFARMYETDGKGGRPSIAPEKLVRALLLQVLYSIRSERMLVEQISYNMLSTTDEQARLFRKSKGTGAMLCYMGHVLTDNRHGLVVNAQVTLATGTAERDAAGQMLADAASVAPRAITVGADKNYDTAGFVAGCRANRVTPHVAQNDGRPGGSAIDERTTRWPGYAVSQQKRKRIEQVFGWGKTVGRIRQAMYRGLERVDQLFVLTQVGYNLTRMRTLAG
jgi:IS5 family transposase